MSRGLSAKQRKIMTTLEGKPSALFVLNTSEWKRSAVVSLRRSVKSLERRGLVLTFPAMLLGRGVFAFGLPTTVMEKAQEFVDEHTKPVTAADVYSQVTKLVAMSERLKRQQGVSVADEPEATHSEPLSVAHSIAATLKDAP